MSARIKAMLPHGEKCNAFGRIVLAMTIVPDCVEEKCRSAG